jgi:acyl-CoA oxidase
VQCTWEGDNTILTLQAGRYLISSYREAANGKRLAPGVGYLNSLATLIGKQCSVQSVEEMMDLGLLVEAWQVVCANVVKNAALEFEACVARGLSVDDAYKECCKLDIILQQRRMSYVSSFFLLIVFL